ncbi:MAG: CHASE2 domain-containing protein [Planctomycetota bacterium]
MAASDEIHIHRSASDGAPVSDVRGVARTRRLLWGLCAGVLVGAGVVLLSFTVPFATLESLTLDWRQQALARPSAALDGVAVVLIDEFSIREFKKDGVTWPWPREMYLPIVQFLADAGARAIVFDLLFVDPSPQRLYDEEFGAAVAAAGNVVLAAKLDTGAEGLGIEPAALEKIRAPLDAAWPFANSRAHDSLNVPIPELLRAARGLGCVNVLQDPDNTLRRADLVLPLAGAPASPVASLALMAAVSAHPDGTSAKLRVTDREITRADGTRLALGRDGRALVRFYGPEQTVLTRNAAAVIRSFVAREEGGELSLSPDDFKGRIVFIGVNAHGMEDIVPVPMSARFSGTEFMATVCANILGGEFLRESSNFWRGFGVIALSIAAGLCCFLVWRPLAVIVVAALALVAVTAIAADAYRGGIALELFAPALAISGVALAALIAGHLTEGRQKREVARAFSQYLSPIVIRELMKTPGELKLGGETREITVYFSDIQGFSTFSEGMTPQELVAFLNDYLTIMTDAILDRRGVVDKYEGDAIMAMWGAPLRLDAHAIEACHAVIEQQRALRELNARFAAEGRPVLKFRAGLNTGTAVVGNMGSTRRFSYTAMGDTVNLASRLEGANKFFATGVMLSAATRAAAGDAIEVRRLGRIRVVGKNIPTEVYELLGARGTLDNEGRDRLERYHYAVERLERGAVAEAETIFVKLATESPDRVIQLYLDKCRELHGANVTTWDGVWVLESKG